MKRAQSSLVSELNIRAADALDKAGKMPPGQERAEAMQKATILENAVEMLEHLSGKVGEPLHRSPTLIGSDTQGKSIWQGS